MPPELAAALRAELSERRVFEDTCGPYRSEKELIGGADDESALLHFTHRFTTSASRVQFVALGTGKHFEPTSTALRAFFHDGRVTVLDLACGSGGGLLGLLGTVAELRRRDAHARLPVDLHVLAADISPAARSIHGCMLKRVQPFLESVGIRLTHAYFHWDVTDDFSTARLMSAWLGGSERAEAALVFLSAFGGFTEDNAPAVQTAIRDVLVRFTDDRQVLVAWIEPDMKKTSRWVGPLTEMLTRLFRGRGQVRSPDVSVKFDWRHPFTGVSITGGAKVIACEWRRA